MRAYVHAEIGTTGTFEDIEFDPGNEDSVRDAIAFAVEVEHPCSDSSCDIAMALEEGFPFAAAHLLSGATETPFLDAVMEAAGINQIDWPAGWDEWVKFFRENTWECEACGSYTKNDEESCYNCGQRLV